MGRGPESAANQHTPGSTTSPKPRMDCPGTPVMRGTRISMGIFHLASPPVATCRADKGCVLMPEAWIQLLQGRV